MPTMTDLQWVEECAYIERTTAVQGNVPEMNRDRATFIRYCTMQRDSASKDGQHDSATYIQHCIDDLMPACAEEYRDIDARR